jgi:ATP-dependent DNA helicase RecG
MENLSFIQELVNNKNELNVTFLKSIDQDLILKIICGYLNTEGGWIVIGHTGNHPISINNVENNAVTILKTEVNNRIHPQPLVYIAHDKDQDDNIYILINILKGSRQPYTLNNEFYVYENKEVKQANQDDISVMLRSSNEYSSTWEKATTIDCSLSDLNTDEILKTITEANKMSKGDVLPNTTEEFLNYFQLIDYGDVKNGAVVLFANTPTKFLQQCRIRISVLPEGKTGNVINDIEIIEDNIFVAFRRVQEYFKHYNPLISKFDKTRWDRNTALKFPSEAVDEAIVNAMVHRDYGDVSGDITINIYPDKMEVINSGEIPEDIVKKKTNIKAHHSVLRNPTIAHMFYLRGKMEKLGRGLTLIRDEFLKAGYKKPEWTFQSGYTTLTLHTTPIDLNERMVLFLKNSNEEAFTRNVYELFFENEISEKTARNDLSTLVEAGYIKQQGKGANTFYSRQEKQLPEDTGNHDVD